MMKPQTQKAIYIIMLILLFGMMGVSFCYFLGKTETMEEAFRGFWRFMIPLLPIFSVAIILIIYDWRKLNRKK